MSKSLQPLGLCSLRGSSVHGILHHMLRLPLKGRLVGIDKVGLLLGNGPGRVPQGAGMQQVIVIQQGDILTGGHLKALVGVAGDQLILFQLLIPDACIGLRTGLHMLAYGLVLTGIHAAELPVLDEQEIPFHQAAEIGTRKVIQEHSTIGLVVTCDGSFGDIPRKNFVDGEEKTVQELKKQGKPFLILVNSKKPYGEEAQKLVRELEEKYQAAVLGVNCEQLRKEDVLRILEKILYEFPVRQIEYYIPKWVELLPVTHYLKEDLLKQMKEKMGTMEYIRDIRQENLEMDSNYVKSVTLEEINLSNGVVKVRIQIEDPYYYQVMSEMTGVTIESEYQLIHTLKELAQMKQEYTKVQQAIESVRGTGYGAG